MLKRLELVGFKSFADKTRFDFAPGITAVVGPNGSGKSNIVDAVRWILGEQSAKTLRGGEMTDVIFNGSSTRKSLGMAEVTVTFDNARRLLAVDADEVQITRRVYRDGTGEYLINGQDARLKDIKDALPRQRGRGRRLHHHRAGPRRRAARGLHQGPPRDLRGGGRHQPLQGEEDRNPPQARRRRGQPAPRPRPAGRARPAVAHAAAPGGQGPAVQGILRPPARAADRPGPPRVPRPHGPHRVRGRRP